MLRTGIEQFVGFWVSESGYRLRIRKVRKDQAFVDFLDPRGAPIARPYMGGAPSMKMVAHYDDYNEDFRVDLWEEGKGLMLHLDHEYDYVLDSEQREALGHVDARQLFALAPPGAEQVGKETHRTPLFPFSRRPRGGACRKRRPEGGG